jgi:hypothetical protein
MKRRQLLKLRNRLWKASKYKKISLTRCSDVRVLNPDGTLKEIIPILSLPKTKIIIEPEQLDFEDNPRRSPEYIEWRGKVMDRDHKTCALCGSKEWIQVHHISRWVDDDSKRFSIDNGVCLCIICHQKHHGPHNAKFPKEITYKLLHYIDGVNGI